jgi:purine-binding chemotaxis protein CheW
MEALVTDTKNDVGLIPDEMALSQGHDRAPVDESQYISFRVGDGQYAVDIMWCREIKGWTEITSLPNQPKYVRGVLNLRGIVVPIIDLRSRFWDESTEATPMHVVIIVNVGEQIVGLLVDAVSDIISIERDRIKDVPEAGQSTDARYLKGLIAFGEEMVAILSLVDLLQDESFDHLNDAQETVSAQSNN